MIRNLTPHAITILRDGMDPLVIPPDPAGPARVSTTLLVVDHATARTLGVSVVVSTPGEVTGLPDPVEGVLLLVSGMVLDAASDRPDLCAPGELVRGPDGQPTGCRGLRVRRW